MDLRTLGLDALLSQVRALGNSTEAERKALEAGAEHVKGELEKAAPVRSGTLKANILKTPIKDGRIDIGTRPVGDGFYGFFLEYGTSKMSARPWARPAWERNKQKVKDIMADELRRGMGL